MATKRQQARVSAWVSTWKKKLFLDNWAVLVTYKEKDSIYKRTDGVAIPICAEIATDPRYTEAYLVIYPTFFTKPVGYQRMTVIHELTHIITHRVREALNTAVRKGAITCRTADDVLEGLTEHIARIPYKNQYPNSTDNYLL